MSNSFDNWWNGLVGFHLNSEHAYEQIGTTASFPDLERWMKACWNAAIEAAQEAVTLQDDCDISHLQVK